jgi:hypothetical protein
MARDPQLARIRRAQSRLARAEECAEEAAAELRQAILAALEEHSLAEVAVVLGVSRQFVHQIVAGQRRAPSGRHRARRQS